MKRQALGKGLSSLIPEPSQPADAGLLLLDVRRIQPNRYQPRVDFGRLEGLVESIRENGIVQPVIVKQEADGYRLIAGERRWRAAQIAGIERIPAIVMKVAEEVARDLLSVRETEERVAGLLGQARKRGRRAPQTRTTAGDPNVEAAADRLTRALATKVRIVKREEGGRIEIDFYSDEELQRLYEFLVTAEKGH